MATEGMFDKLKMLGGPAGWGGRPGWYAGASLTGELLLAREMILRPRRLDFDSNL